ncbi:MAG: hypothetical protein EBS06_06935 [Proteobacteria bacterium]|nr:hypothetical protein [Pseudomonadota bacterium]
MKADDEMILQNFLSKQDGLISAIIQRPEDLLREAKKDISNEECEKILAPTTESVTQFLRKNYLDENGKINHQKLRQDFQTLADIDSTVLHFLPQNLTETKVEQSWSEKYSSKKSAEVEDPIPQKKSWKDALKATNKSKDDSTITR